MTIRALALLAATLLLIGCAAPARPANGRFEIVRELEAGSGVRAEWVFPLEPGVRTVAPWGEGASIPVTTEKTTRLGATVLVRTEGVRTEFLGRDGGTVVLTGVIEDDSGTLTRFDPPLPVAWETLDAGQSRDGTASMRVLGAESGRVREKGAARRTMTYERDEQVRTPLGELRAKRVVITFTANLRLANAEETLVLWITEEHGVVASERTKSVRVLGLPGRESVERLVRLP